MLHGHSDPIFRLHFCPFDARFLASSAESLKIWDLTEDKEINEEEQKAFFEKDQKDIDGALFFDHKGHINKITDFQWSD